MKSWMIDQAERGRVPDPLLRMGIRRLLKGRLDALVARPESTAEFLERLRDQPVAVESDAANEQHYEVSVRFFLKVLGSRLKYSSCLWSEGVEDLASAENAMLDLTCQRAQLEDRMDILELGCGWGSLTLWMAERFPNARILAVSNSATQKAYIEVQAVDRGFCNVEVRTCDVNDLDPGKTFDRIVSVEMFEHMRNPGMLLDRAAEWLNPAGKMFIHVFTHSGAPYLFEDGGDAKDWMSKYFFTGGMMPSSELLPQSTSALDLDEEWIVNGSHYSRTLEAWLARQDAARDSILPLMAKTYGEDEAERWFNRWRIFWMACSELFRYNSGNQWPVHHYRFKKAQTSSPQ